MILGYENFLLYIAYLLVYMILFAWKAHVKQIPEFPPRLRRVARDRIGIGNRGSDWHSAPGYGYGSTTIN
jgi:hypothetical protein